MQLLRRITRLLGSACLGLGAGGCHEYVPVQNGTTLPSDVTVQATLTDVGAVAVAPVFGPRIRIIEGALVSRTDSALVLRVRQVTRADGTEQTINGDQVVLSGSSVQDVGYVRTAVGRSVILAAVIVTGVVAAASGFGRSGSSVGGNGVTTPGAPK